MFKLLKPRQLSNTYHYLQQQYHNRLFSTQTKIKQHLNIGTIGDELHGKTTLSKAILNVLDNNDELHATSANFNSLNKDKLSQCGSSRTINFEFETLKNHYLLADNSGNKDHVSNMIVGSSQLECCILVVSAIDGISNTAKEHLLIIKHLQISNLIIYFNKIDDENYDKELHELIELEIKEILTSTKYQHIPIDRIPFIHGSALNALENTNDNLGKDSIIQLLTELDKLEINESGQLQNDENLPFLFPIQIIHNIKGVGIAVIGKTIQGIINTGDNVELIGGVPLPNDLKNKKLISQYKAKTNITASVASLKLFDHSIKMGKKRDYLGIALHGQNVNTKTIKRGMYVVKQKNQDMIVKGYLKFKCNLEIFVLDDNDQIGRSGSISIGFEPIFHFITNDITGNIYDIPKENNNVILPGDTVEGITVCLRQSAVIWKDLRFILREAGKTIGVGVITEPIDL